MPVKFSRANSESFELHIPSYLLDSEKKFTSVLLLLYLFCKAPHFFHCNKISMRIKKTLNDHNCFNYKEFARGSFVSSKVSNMPTIREKYNTIGLLLTNP